MATVPAPVLGQALTTAFIYQGQVRAGGAPANGLHDFRFRLYDAASGGALVGSPVCADNLSLADGQFTAMLDFGAAFSGQQRFLEIEVRADSGLNCSSATGFVTLAPRQALTAVPNALFALSTSQLNGQPPTFYQDASNLTTGTLSIARLPATIALSGSSATEILRGTNSSGANSAAGVRGVSTSETGITYGVEGMIASPSGAGVSGYSESPDGAGMGVFGMTESDNGAGVGGYTLAEFGPSHGVYGWSNSADGAGVVGEAAAVLGAPVGVRGTAIYGANGTGVLGKALSPTGSTVGVHGEVVSANGIAVRGQAGDSSAYAGYFAGGRNYFEGRIGVGDTTPATSLDVVGNWTNEQGAIQLQGDKPTIRFSGGSQSNNASWIAHLGTGGTMGFFHLATAPSTWSNVMLMTPGGNVGVGTTSPTAVVHALTTNISATAVRGDAMAQGAYFVASNPAGATGVYAEASNAFTSNTTWGVNALARSSRGIGLDGTTLGTFAGAFGVRSGGDFAASGTKAFRIDHPDDPANKYLLHYCAESPEVINFYRGTVMLDGVGGAIVELPHYFAKINRIPSYQLTAVGAPMPTLHVAEKISELSLELGAQAEPGEAAPLCWFRIAGGAPGGEVSWRVEAVRNDRWMKRYGEAAPVELTKPDEELGTYQHPELYGMPAEKRLNYRPQNAPQD